MSILANAAWLVAGAFIYAAPVMLTLVLSMLLFSWRTAGQGYFDGWDHIVMKNGKPLDQPVQLFYVLLWLALSISILILDMLASFGRFIYSHIASLIA